MAQRNNQKSRTKNGPHEQTNKQNDDPSQGSSLFMDSERIQTLFVDFIKFSIGSKWHYTD